MNKLRLMSMACGAALLMLAAAAHALEFKSVGEKPAVLYDAPSAKGKKVFVAPRGMPVEVVLTYGDWTKVRDAGGDLSWIESNLLTSKRTLVVKIPNAKVRAAPDDNGTVVFSCDKGVLLEPVEPAASGWVKVKHRDGQAGFVKASEIWGT
ncbi:MAG: SH3 domain-containing protein [Burkholderiales bacterium]|nr:SH3 domain-containing protein [Burkholderiales bacterium]